MTSAENNCCPLTRVAALLKSASEHERWKAYEEAELLCREAIDIARTELGADHQVLGTTLRDLGDILTRQERLFEAREAYTEALTILEKCLGNRDPGVLHLFGHLMELYR
jgi:tetratricopeptide (TPR) repeat protein